MIPNGTLCHFWHYGDSTIKVGVVVKQPDPIDPGAKIWGGHAPSPRYGVEFNDPQFGKLLIYATAESIIPYESQVTK